jgi:hypothetical protein
MDTGFLSIYRTVKQSFWIGDGADIVQVTLTEAGGRGLSAFSRVLVCAPKSVKVSRELNREWPELERTPDSHRTPKIAIVEALQAAAQAHKPTSTGSIVIDNAMIADIARALLADLQAQGCNVDRKT